MFIEQTIKDDLESGNNYQESNIRTVAEEQDFEFIKDLRNELEVIK